MGPPADNRSSCFFQNICDEDILSQIFEHLAGYSQTLSVFARTHSLFTELALDTLWKELDSLFPLLRILPAFQKIDGTYVLRGSIHPHDWERFDWYARRVRVFHYARDLTRTVDIAMHVYFRVAQLRNSPLLPELQRLICPSIRHRCDILIPAICLFLSPNLQSIDFSDITTKEEKLIGTFLHMLITDGSKMEKIILKGQGLSKDTLNLLPSFPLLQKLELTGMGPSLDAELLEELGRLAYLEDLEIDFALCPMKTLNEEIGMFSLKHLTLNNPPLLLAISFISRIALSCQLRALYIRSSPDPEPPEDPNNDIDVKAFFEDIVSRWRTSLRRILISRNEETEEMMLSSCLVPLLALHELTFFNLYGYTMDLSDEDIQLFACSWPNIQQLHLPFAPLSSRPSITSLSTVARHCPQLSELRIPLEIGIPIPYNLANTDIARIRHTKLETLTLARGGDDAFSMRELLQLARYIYSIFPCISSVWSYSPDDCDLWDNLDDIIQTFQYVKSDAMSYHTRS